MAWWEAGASCEWECVGGWGQSGTVEDTLPEFGWLLREPHARCHTAPEVLPQLVPCQHCACSLVSPAQLWGPDTQALSSH